MNMIKQSALSNAAKIRIYAIFAGLLCGIIVCLRIIEFILVSDGYTFYIAFAFGDAIGSLLCYVVSDWIGRNSSLTYWFIASCMVSIFIIWSSSTGIILELMIGICVGAVACTTIVFVSGIYIVIYLCSF